MAHSVPKSYESVGTRNENSFIFRNVFSKYKKIKKGPTKLHSSGIQGMNYGKKSGYLKERR